MDRQPLRILIVDDDPGILSVISAMLRHWDYQVVSASNGLEAWEILQQHPIRFVISDWMMPGLSGPELFQRIRATGADYYIYLILLTGREDKSSLIEGMDAGADDFLVKPVHREELRVRVRAGERILRLEQQLAERNQRLNDTNHSLSRAYETVRQDLQSAAALQKALLPPPACLPGVTIDWLFQPSSYLAGDMFDYFSLDDQLLSFYQLDVAGHGVPSALLSFTVHRLLSQGSEERRLLKRAWAQSPVLVVSELNQRFQSLDSALYFTMIYGCLDRQRGRVTLTQAGHPSPLWLRRDRRQITPIGQCGFPVGLLPDVDYDTMDIELAVGDRLFLYSDGITDCENAAGEAFSEPRFCQLLEETADLSPRAVTEQVSRALHDWKGDDQHLDDISVLLLERTSWT